MSITTWATLDDLPPANERPNLPGGDEAWTALLVSASEVLYALTGRRFGGVRERAIELFAPARCGAHRCRTCRPDSVRLPNRPVVELLSVGLVSGAEFDLAGYRIGRGGYLERARGSSAIMPTCGSGLAVRYRFGRAPSAAGVQHARQLALAYGSAVVDPDSSPLPGTIVSIVRQGVTITQQSASALVEQGMTGLAPVDSWIGSVNPTRSRRPGRSWSPDTDAPFYPLPLPEEAS